MICRDCNHRKASTKSGRCSECQHSRDMDLQDRLREEHAPEPRERSDYEEHNTHWNRNGRA